MTLKEVARLLKVAKKTVYTMAQRKEMPAFKVHGQWRFGVAPFQWTVKGLGFMQLPGGSSRRRWGIADQGPGDDDGGYTIPR